MIETNEKDEKICLFFASDFHFEMISLPFIRNNLQENNNILVMTENNLKKSIDRLLSMVNLNSEEKNNILKIDWNNSYKNKIYKIKEYRESKENTIIFIKGKEDFIKKINKEINDYVDIPEIRVIDCYDINEIQNKAMIISKNYNKVLSTSGFEELSCIN